MCFASFALAWFCFGSNAYAAERKVALVIGNSAYQAAGKLENPLNDAGDVSRKLKSLGFEVIEGFDLSKQEMDTAIRSFSGALENAALGLFFYAGHGLQVSGVNYLVPIDAQVKSASALDFELVRLDQIQKTMELEARANIILLDACRNNPFARSLTAGRSGARSVDVGRGLARMEVGRGTLISFSTQPGNVALDGNGRNSPYAAALVRHLGLPGQDLSSSLIEVRKEVLQQTDGSQIPWDHSALLERIVLAPDPNAPAASATPPPTAPPAADNSQAWRDDMRALLEEMRKSKGTEPSAPAKKPETDNGAPRDIDIKQVWDSIQHTTSEAVLGTFIVRAAGTIYADLARARLDEVRQSATRQTQQPQTPPQEPPPTASSPPEAADPPAPTLSVCEQLWRERNAIFHRFGYCFTGGRGLEIFGNAGCFRNNDQAWQVMGEANRKNVNRIKQLERQNGC